MNFRDLSGEEMLAVSAPLLDVEGNLYPILVAHELLEGPTAIIRQSHDELLVVHEKQGTNEKQARELTAEMTELDALHDSMARGINAILVGLEHLAETVEEAQIYVDLRETLFPKGRSITQRSYREQAGMAKRVEQRLSDDDRDLLKGIDAGGVTLLSHVDKWLKTAQLIAKKEAERAELTNDDSEDAVSAGEVRDARLKWIRAVHSLLNMLEFTEINERDERVLLANLKDAAHKATASRLRAQARDEEFEDGGEAPVDDSDIVDEGGEAPLVDVEQDPEVVEPV